MRQRLFRLWYGRRLGEVGWSRRRCLADFLVTGDPGEGLHIMQLAFEEVVRTSICYVVVYVGRWLAV